jgi:hypothetical protein
MVAAEHDRSTCPRCGQPIQRERRRPAHRLLSLVYPVRYYVCSGDCGWTGLLSATSQLRMRKRPSVRVLIAIFLALCGIGAARYLVSSPSTPSE